MPIGQTDSRFLNRSDSRYRHITFTEKNKNKNKIKAIFIDGPYVT
jgi:hypothetical protein